MSNSKKLVITSKNILSKAAVAATLNEVVYQLAKKFSNQEIFDLLKKQKRSFSENSVRWYASKSRAGVKR